MYGNPYFDTVPFDAVFDVEDDQGIPFDVVDPSPSPEEQLLATESEEAVRAFVSKLGDADRALVERIFWRHDNQADVARESKVSAAAISKRMRRIANRGRLELEAVRPN